jgi:hypothetical protein
MSEPISNISEIELDPTEIQQLFNHLHPLEMTDQERAK